MRKKKKRNYNARIFKARRAYSLAEIAEILDIHIRTVQLWKKEGLKILDDKRKPSLVMGRDIRDFLISRLRKRKKPLQRGEFFCPKCHEPRRSLPEMLRVEITQRRIGKAYKQAFLHGTCGVCRHPLLLFSSDRKIEEWRKTGLILAEPMKVLNGIENSSVITDILKG